METRIGFRPVGPDLRPMLGWVSGLDGLVVGNGLGPSGLTIGPLAGRLLAQLVLGEAPELDLAPCDPPRASSATEAGGADAIRRRGRTGPHRRLSAHCGHLCCAVGLPKADLAC